MSNINKNQNYVIIANLYSNENYNYNTLIAYQDQNTLENLYILNQFDYDKNNTEILEMLFSGFKSKSKPKEYVNFFIENNKYYAVFKYHQLKNITTFFNKKYNNSHFSERCTILEEILIRIYNMIKIPDEILGSLTEPENILLNTDKNIIFNGNLKNLNKYSDEKTRQKLIYKNIHDIIYTILEPECSMGFNKSLHIVLDKCKNNVYASIPEMIIELKKAEEVSKTNSWISYIKYLYSLRKPIITKLTKSAITLLLIFSVFYLAYNKLTADSRTRSSVFLATIGDTAYNANTEDSTDKTISAENIDNQSGDDSSSNITLSEGLDMEFEDYIVQDKDNITSIAENYYKDTKYATAIATFNGLDISEKLQAGSIIKLPNRTAISLYLAR